MKTIFRNFNVKAVVFVVVFLSSHISNASDEKAPFAVKGVSAEAAAANALKEGDKAPDFTLPAASGEDVTLSRLLQQGPVILIWYRGEWCPYCSEQLAGLQKRLPEIREAGAAAAAITLELPDRAWSAEDIQALEFHVLSDAGGHVSNDYNLLFNLPEKSRTFLKDFFDEKDTYGSMAGVLPVPAAYVIAPDRTISYAYVNADYKKRADMDTLIQEVQKISQP